MTKNSKVCETDLKNNSQEVNVSSEDLHRRSSLGRVLGAETAPDQENSPKPTMLGP